MCGGFWLILGSSVSEGTLHFQAEVQDGQQFDH
jgi:hypothetical protein